MTELQALQRESYERKQRITLLETQVAALRAFANEMLKYQDGSADGNDIQEAGVKHGLLELSHGNGAMPGGCVHLRRVRLSDAVLPQNSDTRSITSGQLRSAQGEGMTPEDRSKRKAEREERKRRDAERFPGCHYDQNGLQIILDEGWARSLTIRTNDLTRFDKDLRVGENHSWVMAYVPLTDIGAVSRLVYALSMRLKFMIEEANQNIEKISIPTLAVPKNKAGAA